MDKQKPYEQLRLLNDLMERYLDLMEMDEAEEKSGKKESCKKEDK